RLVAPLEYSILVRETHERARVARKPQRLFHADTEETLAAKRITEQPNGAVLKLSVKVDKHVAAGNQMDFSEYAVGCKTVVREYDVLPEGLVENGPAICG